MKFYSTMRAHSRHNSKQQRALKIFAGALVILAVGLLLPSTITAVSRVLFYPVIITKTWLNESSSVFPMYIRDRQSLVDEVKTLKNELAIAGGTDLTQQRLFEENTWLRELLNAKSGDRIAGAIIARPNELPYDLLQIDKGSNDGVVVGSPVYIGADNVIGIIVSTAPEFSFAELFTSPGFEATIFISGPNVVATLEGYGGGVARARVPQGISLSVGNVVYLPSIEPGAFGRIAYIENKPSQPEQYGYITFDKPLSSLHFVAIGKSSIKPTTPDRVSEEVRALINASIKVNTEEVVVASSSDMAVTSTSSNTISNE
jgi:cell shape-determining protein MreC